MKKKDSAIWQEQTEDVKAKFRDEAKKFMADQSVREKTIVNFSIESAKDNFTKFCDLNNLQLQELSQKMDDFHENIARRLFYKEFNILPYTKEQQELAYIVSIINSAKKNNESAVKRKIILSGLEQNPIDAISRFIMEIISELFEFGFGLEWHNAGQPSVADISQLKQWINRRGFKTFIYKLQMLNALQRHRNLLQNQPEQSKIDMQAEKVRLDKLLKNVPFNNRNKLSALISVLKRHDLLDRHKHSNRKHYSTLALIIYLQWIKKTTPTFSKWKKAFLDYCGMEYDTYKNNKLETEAVKLMRKYLFFNDLEDIEAFNRNEEDDAKST